MMQLNDATSSPGAGAYTTKFILGRLTKDQNENKTE